MSSKKKNRNSDHHNTIYFYTETHVRIAFNCSIFNFPEISPALMDDCWHSREVSKGFCCMGSSKKHGCQVTVTFWETVGPTSSPELIHFTSIEFGIFLRPVGVNVVKSSHPPCVGPSHTKSPPLRWYYFGVEPFWLFGPYPRPRCVSKIEDTS